MKKIIAMTIATVMLLGLLAGCGSTEAQYQVGVVQLMQHVALDQATQGFQDALKEKLGI